MTRTKTYPRAARCYGSLSVAMGVAVCFASCRDFSASVAGREENVAGVAGSDRVGEPIAGQLNGGQGGAVGLAGGRARGDAGANDGGGGVGSGSDGGAPPGSQQSGGSAGEDAGSGGSLDAPGLVEPPASLTCFGGPILGHATIYPLYYGAGWTVDTMIPIQAYLAGVTQYLSEVNAPVNRQTVLKQYGVVGASVAAGDLFGSQVPARAIGGDAEIQSIIRDAQNKGHAPPYAPSTLIVLILAKGFSLKGLAASHHSSASPLAFYAALEAPSADNMAIIAREIYNASTDPAGMGPAANAWGAPKASPVDYGGEVADGCISPNGVGPEYSWTGTVTLGASDFPASAKVAIGGRDNSDDGACSTSGYTTTRMLDQVPARGAGRFDASAAAGVFRSALGPAGSNGVSVTGSGWIDVLTSTGDSFTYRQWWADRFWGSHGTLVGDIDRDGNSDLVALNDGRVDVLRSTGKAFREPETWWPGAFYGAIGTFLADVDGDRRVDVVGVSPSFTGLIRSTGTGFGPYEVLLDTALPPSYTALMADVDGDGRAELVDLAVDHVDVYHSTANLCPPAGQQCDLSVGGLTNPRPWFNSVFYGGWGNLSGDVNGDGYDDIVGFAEGYVAVLLSNGLDSFHFDYWLFETASTTNPPLLADVNDDGKQDIVVTDGSTVTVRLSTPVGRGVMGTRFGSAKSWYVAGF